jgi:MFS family permease
MSRPALLRDADFRRYFTARTLSVVGSVITYVALPVLVYRLSDSVSLTAAVTLLEALPYALFGLLAGALSDRWDRRRTMIVADLVDAVLMLSIPVAHWSDVLTVAHVLAVAFAVPAVSVFFDGANFGALPTLVGRSQVARANSMVMSASTLADIVVPSAVGLVLAVTHPSTLIGLDALSFLASAACIRGIGRPLQRPDRDRSPATVRAVRADIAVGLRFLAGHGGVRSMTVVGTLQCISGGGFVSLMVAWFDRTLDIGTEGWRFGVTWSAWSAGALLAALALPRVLDHVRPEQVTLLALPFSAALGLATALATTWQLAAAGLLAWSAAYTLVMVNSVSYRQVVTPDELLGRVNTAGRMLSWGLGWPVGAGLAAAVAGAAGVRSALLVVTAVGVLAAAFAWRSPLVGLAREPEPLPG